MSAPQVIRTPKHYYVARRLEGHSDWSFAFWRELFQNSVDAGAKRIDITLEDADGKGSFGREPTVDRVVRVTFTDDGRGMDGDVLENVFFRPGESTKKKGDRATGGFGTARLMLCFSQVRYGIRTRDWVVEGDGSEYTCQTVADAIEAKKAEFRKANEAGDTERALRIDAELRQLMADKAPLKGCRFEIDVDPKETETSWRNVDLAKLKARLDEYLSMSQVPCKVFVNGREVTEKAMRGPAKRKLVATLDDGREVEFGTIHTSQGEKARHKGRVIVRADGAAMFIEDTSSTHQVIVELDPSVAKEVLTENRDSLKQPYRAALAGFLEELVVDTKSALDEKEKRKHIEIKGGRGKLKASAPVSAIDFATAVDGHGKAVREAKLPDARYTTAEQYEVQGFGGVPKPVMDAFVQKVAEGEETFIDGLDNADIKAFIEAVRAGEGAAALAKVSPELGSMIAAVIAERMAQAGVDAKAAEDPRFADMHDVHIQVEDIGDSEQLKNAMRRYHPSYWRRKGQHLEGRGMQAHMLLAAWTVSVEYAVKALLACDPSLAKDGELSYATGWYFGKSERQYLSRGWRDVRTDAQHQERDGTHIFLLNPVFDNGAQAYDLTRERREVRVDAEGRELPKGLQDLEQTAIHEACHVMTSRHDEEFANLQTEVAAMFDRAAARAAMKEAVDAVRAAYGRGRSRIQAMDSQAHATVLEADEAKESKATKDAPEKGAKPKSDAPKAGKGRKTRPAEALLAHAAPVTAMAVGTAAAPENAEFPADALKEAFQGAVTQLDDGVVEVDCDRIASLEQGVAAAARDGWDAPIDLDSIAASADLGEDIPALEGFGDELAGLAAEPLTGPDAGPSPEVAARGTAWEAPIDLSQVAEMAAEAPDLSELDGFGGQLAALATDTPAEPEAPAEAAVEEPVVAKAPRARAARATSEKPAPAASNAPVPPAEPANDAAPVRVAASKSARPEKPAARPDAAAADEWALVREKDEPLPPVVTDPGLGQLVEDDFDMDIFSADAPGLK